MNLKLLFFYIIKFQFFNQDSNTNDEILWNFYSNFSFPKFKPGNYLGLVYDDVNLDVYFITTTGNVYIYIYIYIFIY